MYLCMIGTMFALLGLPHAWLAINKANRGCGDGGLGKKIYLIVDRVCLTT